MRRQVIAGNWKMNKNKGEITKFITSLKVKKIDSLKSEMMLFVPSIYLDTALNLTKGTNIVIGSQNIHQEEAGAYTGEISALMVKDLGINITLIGHSERRQYFNETNKLVNKKLKLALNNDLQAVVCVGEIEAEREANLTYQVIEEQIKEAFANIEAKNLKNIIVAYEPVWAIGTGKTATSSDANEACAFIRKTISKLYNDQIANELVIQYGGSVKPENITELMNTSDIDGGLVGGASLDVDSYYQLLK